MPKSDQLMRDLLVEVTLTLMTLKELSFVLTTKKIVNWIKIKALHLEGEQLLWKAIKLFIRFGIALKKSH